MKVLHIIPYMHPSAGGPPVVVERLAEQAPSSGWSASVITTSQFCEDGGVGLEKSLRQHIDVTVLHQKWGRTFHLQQDAREVIRRGVRQADIVHLHTLWHPFNTLARKACKQFCRKYVLSPHGMLDPYSLGVKALRKQLYLALREGSNLRGASKLIFTTPLEEKLARASLGWLRSGEIVPLGADMPPSVSREKLTATFEAQFPGLAGRRRLIFLGRIHEKKGLERILAVLPMIAAIYPKVLLVVVGSGEPRYVARIQEAAHRKGLGPYVLFTGELQGAAKWSALAAAEAFLLPSHQENFAIAVAEAMHMGLPVVLSDKVNLWPFISEARAGIVVRDDCMAKELGAVIINLLREREEFCAVGARGRLFAGKNFMWKNTSKLTIDLYNRLVDTYDLTKAHNAFEQNRDVAC
jgi:glycosyltransferase involved in cell wall biosynthesis